MARRCQKGRTAFSLPSPVNLVAPFCSASELSKLADLDESDCFASSLTLTTAFLIAGRKNVANAKEFGSRAASYCVGGTKISLGVKTGFAASTAGVFSVSNSAATA